jgi:predicted ATP-dependent endonuclease of OLD family
MLKTAHVFSFKIFLVQNTKLLLEKYIKHQRQHELELLKKQNVIYQSKETFILIINELLQRKDLIVNERNELIVKTQSEKEFDLKFLSSGEKQLVIIFGEALLQKHKPHIFIADEPELSLHIEWQEKLVSSLKLLNPFAQLIFATHSPDVVGGFQDSVVQIENCIS